MHLIKSHPLYLQSQWRQKSPWERSKNEENIIYNNKRKVYVRTGNKASHRTRQSTSPITGIVYGFEITSGEEENEATKKGEAERATTREKQEKENVPSHIKAVDSTRFAWPLPLPHIHYQPPIRFPPFLHPLLSFAPLPISRDRQVASFMRRECRLEL